MSIEVALPDGTLNPHARRAQPRLGPDFMRLFLGSEGTFGIITEATMRVTRLPETRLFRGAAGPGRRRRPRSRPADDGRPPRSAGHPHVRPALDGVAGEARPRLRARGGLHDLGRLRRLDRDRHRAGSAGDADCRRSRAPATSGASPASAGGTTATTSTPSAARVSPPADVRHRRDGLDLRQHRAHLPRQEGGDHQRVRARRGRLHRPFLALVPVGREPLRPLRGEGRAGRSRGGAQAARRHLGRGRPYLAEARRHDQRTPRRRPQAAPLHAGGPGAAWPLLLAIKRAIDPTAS